MCAWQVVSCRMSTLSPACPGFLVLVEWCWCIACFSVGGKHASPLCRLRPDNTYLLLDEFGENGVEDTGLTTELGVMSNEEEEHRDQQVCLASPACLLQESPGPGYL